MINKLKNFYDHSIWHKVLFWIFMVLISFIFSLGLEYFIFNYRALKNPVVAVSSNDIKLIGTHNITVTDRLNRYVKSGKLLRLRRGFYAKDKDYDRIGLEEEYTEYLGNKIVCHNIPIRPGRNLAIICEAAAVNFRQKKMGYNAAQELYRRFQENMAKKRDENDDDED